MLFKLPTSIRNVVWSTNGDQELGFTFKTLNIFIDAFNVYIMSSCGHLCKALGCVIIKTMHFWFNKILWHVKSQHMPYNDNAIN